MAPTFIVKILPSYSKQDKNKTTCIFHHPYCNTIDFFMICVLPLDPNQWLFGLDYMSHFLPSPHCLVLPLAHSAMVQRGRGCMPNIKHWTNLAICHDWDRIPGKSLTIGAVSKVSCWYCRSMVVVNWFGRISTLWWILFKYKVFHLVW